MQTFVIAKSYIVLKKVRASKNIKFYKFFLVNQVNLPYVTVSLTVNHTEMRIPLLALSKDNSPIRCLNGHGCW